MQATSVGQFAEWLKTSPLASDRIWSRPLDQISNTEIQLFYARAGLQGKAKEAHEAIDVLQSELLTLAMQGGISRDMLRIISHEVPQDRFTVDEFVDRLTHMNQARRMAVLLALATRTDPHQIALMEWRHIKGSGQHRGLSKEILEARAKLRHFRLPYVFWEWSTEKIAAPLLGLRAHAEEAFGDTWPSIQARWTDMIWIDARADSNSFMNIVNEVSSGKL